MTFNLLAHGALGYWDEAIFAGVSVLFIIMMGVSWVRSRNMEPEFEDEFPKTKPDDSAADDHSPERFRLD